jgi:RNA polymerase sigma-70 factor (ECF subfamily)
MRDLAATLGISDGAARVALHRLRRRFRDLLREEIAQTVEHPSDVEDEIRHLLAIASQGTAR